MADSGDKTEKPSPERLRKAREKGQFLVSRGLMSAIQFIVAIVLLDGIVTGWRNTLVRTAPQLLNHAISADMSEADLPILLRNIFLQNAVPLVLFFGALFGVTLAAHLGISKLGFSIQRLNPSFERLSPIGKLKELPGQNLKSALEAVILLAALASSINSLLEENGAALLRMSLESTASAVGQMSLSIHSLLWKAAYLFVVFGAVDLARQQRKYMSQLKMSKQEIKEEHKQQQGDPQTRSRIRRMRRDLLRKRMMQDVATATAVVVNPTHFAVAIRYDVETMASPLVVAKGKNWIALRIRQIAVENQIPVIENPPLARALYDAVEVGRSISPEFYKAIAEILAYVYRIMGRGLPR